MSAAEVRPKVHTANVPVELRALDQWVLWRKEPSPKDPAKLTKVPYRVRRPDVGASSTDPVTWAPYAEAVDALNRDPSFSGIGFVVAPPGGIAGVDLDHCINDRGALEQWAAEIVTALDSYTERTPSGRGIRIFVEGSLPEGRRKKGDVEMYEAGRFLTVTGDHWPDARLSVELRTEQLAAIHAKYLASDRPQLRIVAPESIDSGAGDGDAAILERARELPKFRLLYDHGDYRDYPSQSEADLALCSLLVKAGADASGVDRLIRQSRLMRPKWDERHGAQTYGAQTIAKALEYRADSNGARPDEPIVVSTYADVDDSPPEPLICDILEPKGQTIMYSAGGTGKGVTVSCLTKRLQADGLRVMLYDAEQRPREWARRFSSLGVNRGAVVRVQPKDLPPRLMGQPLYDIIPHLGRIVRQESVDVLFIDSIMAGMGVGEEKLRSDAQAPYLVSRALDALEITTCCIGHTPRATPDGDPYGSVAWVNAFRLTWHGVKAEGPGHRVRWRPRKRNERGHLPTSLWTFDWDQIGRLTGCSIADDSIVMRDWVRLALALGPRTVDDLADERLSDSDDVTTQALDRVKAALRQTLNRMRRDKDVEKEAGRGGTWRMRR